jgi:hypothetical protein
MGADAAGGSAWREVLSHLPAVDGFRPASSQVRVVIDARSHQGRVGSTNEDHQVFAQYHITRPRTLAWAEY